MRLIVITALAGLLLACTSTTETTTPEIISKNDVSIELTNSALPSVDSSTLSLEQLSWYSKMLEYEKSSAISVKIPYSQKLSQLESLPESEYCSNKFKSLLVESLSLNPTSIMAHSMMLMCAEIENDQEAYDKSNEAIANVSNILLKSGNGENPASAIFTREVYEGQIILSWAGFEVIDMELTRVKNDWFYKMYTFDSESGNFQIFYSQNNDYFRGLVESLSPEKRSDVALAETLLQSLYLINEPSALLYKFREQLQEKNTVVDAESAIMLDSPMVKVLLAYHALNGNDDESLYSLLDPISEMASAGFAPAEAFVSLLLLTTENEQDKADAIALYDSYGETIGYRDTANIWLNALMNLRAPQEALENLLSQASQAQLSAMSEAVLDFYLAQEEYPDPVNIKLFSMLNLLADANETEAQYKAAKGWLNGGWSNELDIQKGLSLLKKSALGGHSEGQLDWGFYNSSGKFGLDKNREVAIRWYAKAAAQNNPWALYNLGNAYKDGNSVVADPVKSAEFYKRSWQHGYTPSACYLGNVYQYQFTPAEISKARGVYERALSEGKDEKGLIECIYQAGIIALRHDNDGNKGIPLMERAARLGSKDALFELAVAYFYGHGVDIDKSTAKVWYEKAVDAGHGGAAANLGFMYEGGDLVDRDLKKAFELYTLAAKLENGQGMNNLGTFYFRGIAVEKDVEKGLALYKKAADMNVDFALDNLADEYWDGKHLEQNKELACDYYERAYEQSFIEAFMDIGYCYLEGQGRKKDITKGIEIMEAGVAKNDSDSIIELADFYFEEDGDTKDNRKAIDLYSKALEFNSSLAAFRLGEAYKEESQFTQSQEHFTLAWKWGEKNAAFELAKLYVMDVANNKGIFAILEDYAKKYDSDPNFLIALEYHFNQDGAPDYSKAREHYLLAAENKHEGSLNNLGELYRYANGVEKDLDKAMNFYQRAFEQRSAYGALNIAQLYDEGVFGTPDLSEAFKYFLVSAERGLHLGMYQAGVRLHDGVGVQADTQRGKEWINKAAEKNNKDAIKWLKDNRS